MRFNNYGALVDDDSSRNQTESMQETLTLNVKSSSQDEFESTTKTQASKTRITLKNVAIFLMAVGAVAAFPVLLTSGSIESVVSTYFTTTTIPISGSTATVVSGTTGTIPLGPIGILPGLVDLVTVAPTKSPSLAPTFEPTVYVADDDYYLGYYESKSIRFTTNRDQYENLPYFSQNASTVIKYKHLERYTGVIEPYADMWINVFVDGEEGDEDYEEGQYVYKYNVKPEGGDTMTIYSDDTASNVTEFEGWDYQDTFKVSCAPLVSTFSITVAQYDAETKEATGKEETGYFMCHYVRREMRALSESDLSKTMDAMLMMWTLSEEDGVALYGEDYHNYAYLLEFHYFNAAWRHSDHVHEGNGFQPQHMKMTNVFEKAMQSVDPSITLPYWDFTIESAYNISVWDSPIFTNETFGEMPMPANLTWGWLYESNTVDDGAIRSGRWMNMEADNNEKYPELDYSYGYMRAPWNMNPSKYITRYTSVDKTLPTCESHYKLLEYSSIIDFLHQIPYDAHASTHGVIGGVFGCDVFNGLREAGYINGVEGQLELCKNWIFYLKEFYRSAVLLPESDCTAEDESRGYSTAKEDLTCTYVCDNSRLNILFLMLKHSVLNSDYDCIPDEDTMPEEGWTAWKEFICGGEGSLSFGGDHLESASPADPSFWPIHPALERVLQAKYMSGGFDTDTWPTDEDEAYVCNKATCYSEDDGDFGEWDFCCYGHFQYDQMFDAPNNDRTTYVGPTNNEMMVNTNPSKNTYGMKYIYDSFSWDHCAETGYDMVGLINTLHAGLVFNISSSDSERGWRKV